MKKLSGGQKIGIIILVAAAMGGGAYLIWKQMTKNDKKDSGSGSETPPVVPPTPNMPPSITPNITVKTTPSKSFISYGDKNANVGLVQKYLKKKYNADLGKYGANKDGIDYDFGNKTLAALKKYEGVDSVSKDLFLKMSNYVNGK